MRCWRCCLERNSTQTRGVFSSCGCIHSSQWLHPEPAGFSLCALWHMNYLYPTGHAVHCDTRGCRGWEGLRSCAASAGSGSEELHERVAAPFHRDPPEPSACILTSWVPVCVSDPGEVTQEYVGTAFYCRILLPKLCRWEVTGEQLHWLRWKYCRRKL